ncbi:hypothetical protein [Candidatus Viridilinea mediisalina]|uniref:Gram-positive cocci surface proteins LPxTG domain-containing protein n=1 Tax=Candidatus Viridilinea mediisalina TaxID=2024553 RepID=A0A2A6RE33_9CHLR|nr:hypothetical protein [Candidatus Viridilinea mediisalina]PDW00960.1 hypothetical protein CJ255_19955 [Candidatus Viridilinea mediisalina]
MATTRLLRQLLTLMLITGLLVVSAALGSSGQAFAQTVPGGEPPTAPPPPAPALPPAPSEPIEGVCVPPYYQQGAWAGISLPRLPGDSVDPEVNVYIPGEALRNLTDRWGNVACPYWLEVDVAPTDVTSALPPPMANGSVLLTVMVRARLLDGNRNVIERPNFNPPATICFRLPPERVAIANGLDGVQLYNFDRLLGQWVTLPTAVLDGQLCGTVTHFSVFSLTAAPASSELPIPAALPTTGTADGLRLDLWLGLGLFLVALGGVVRRVQRGVRS